MARTRNAKFPQRVHRETLRSVLRELGLPAKLPRNFSATYTAVPLPSSDFDRNILANWEVRRVMVDYTPDNWRWASKFLPKVGADKLNPRLVLGLYDVVVKAIPLGTPYRRIHKSSRHRIYVVCDCGRHIPAGRMHQHVCKAK